jgi:hypothetical protein
MFDNKRHNPRKRIIHFFSTERSLEEFFFFCYKSHVYVGEMKVGIISTSKYILNGTSRGVQKWRKLEQAAAIFWKFFENIYEKLLEKLSRFSKNS